MAFHLVCFFLQLLLLTTFLNFSFGRHFNVTSSRKAIEIGIGIGIGGGGGGGGGGSPSPPGSGCPCTPPPPPPCTPNGPITQACFPNVLLYNAYLVIQRFRGTITSDPQGITNTWAGTDICSKTSYLGFFCETPPNRVNTPTVASVDFNGYRLGAPTVCGFVDQLPDLALFHANSNNFGGTVPDLSGLRFFYELDVSNNKLTGAFPADVLCLNNATFLDLRFNGYVGAVPPQVFVLSMLQIEQLNLADNKLYGEVPDVLCRLGSPGVGNLMNLSLSDNYFTSLGPSCWALLKKGMLDVRKNCIPGVPDQRLPEECKLFLWQKKYCPLNTYVPCQSPWPEGADQLNSKGTAAAPETMPVADGGRDRSRASGYTTYSALHQNPKP
ncbi:Uncharacterized protein ACMD2_15840 [Ananas comosus]|uniref:Uncharacterized protein n=1 Tax=Ananas comosus TaxID=4615 RepID=A0A199UR95_ANACO|nr:Uncharacterized protein ACMD2_15840 [Ananas comosus]